jgi:uncharacterized membrane protein
MNQTFLSNFMRCGVAGWCIEIIYTSLESFHHNHKQHRLNGHTSLWMFPIYGMAACLTPLQKQIRQKSILFRGLSYMVCIYAAEFVSGFLLRQIDACPWDYSKEKTNVCGLIRLDFAFYWFAAGLFFERLMTKTGSIPTRRII